MNVKRRSLFPMLASLPFIGKAFASKPEIDSTVFGQSEWVTEHDEFGGVAVSPPAVKIDHQENAPMMLKIVPPESVLNAKTPRPYSSMGMKVVDSATGRLVQGVTRATWTAAVDDVVKLTVETVVVDPLSHIEGMGKIIHICSKCHDELDIESRKHKSDSFGGVSVYESLKTKGGE